MKKLLLEKISIFDKHTIEVISKSVSSTIVKVLGMLLGLIISIFIGKKLGSAGLGIINLSFQIATVFMTISLLGIQQVLIKDIAIGYNMRKWEHIRNSMFTAYIINGLTVTFISVILVLSSPWISNKVFNEPDLTIPLSIAFIAMIPQVFSRIFSSALIGFSKIWQSNLVDQTLSMSIVGTILLFFWLFNYRITTTSVSIAYGISRLSVMLIIGIYWKKIFPHKGKVQFMGKKMLKIALPLLSISVTTMISASVATVLLGWLTSSTQVGLYSVALKIAFLTIFFLQVTNSAISPKLASLYAEGKVKEIEKMVQHITRGLILIALSFLILFIFVGKYILGLWGEEFVEAYKILVILSIGQFVNISTGASGLILIMCGFEKTHSLISIYMMIFNIAISYVLIKFFGITGAAISTATSIAIENIIKVYLAYKKTGVLSVPRIKILVI